MQDSVSYDYGYSLTLEDVSLESKAWTFCFFAGPEIEGKGVVGVSRLYVYDAAPYENSPLPLAAERTRRKDPLNSFNKYIYGWNISDNHYWAVST